jgi:hypothetical protein
VAYLLIFSCTAHTNAVQIAIGCFPAMLIMIIGPVNYFIQGVQ